MILCLVLGQMGNSFGHKFRRLPQPDENLEASFKGMGSEFNYYNTTPASHLLVGPAGSWVLLPYQQRATTEFKRNRRHMTNRGFLQRYMRVLSLEGLGKPRVKKFLTKRLDGQDLPEVNALIVFTSNNVELDTDQSPAQVLKLIQLKEFMRQQSKNRVLNSQHNQRISEALESC